MSGAGTGCEVICDPIVHFGGLAALFCNAVPGFVDVRRDTFLLDPAAVGTAPFNRDASWGAPGAITVYCGATRRCAAHP